MNNVIVADNGTLLEQRPVVNASAAVAVEDESKVAKLKDRAKEFYQQHAAAVNFILAAAILGMWFAWGHSASAQSFEIDFDESDLDGFFQWFNLMFNILLPIGLIGAGIVAGGAFVWVVVGMLQRAFTSLLGRGGAR